MTPKELDETMETFQMLALLGPATFLKRLVPLEQADREYLQFNEDNSRNFLVLQLLVEVQKVGFAIERWRKLATDEGLGKPRESYDNNLLLILESVVDEQCMWQRKLTESLVLLINFSLTNSAPHYYHYLLLLDLKRQNRKINDYKQFFGIESATADEKKSRIKAEIEKTENSIGDLTACWYRIRNQQAVISAEAQLKTALQIALPDEKKALGYTYGKGFGETSSNIHTSAVHIERLEPERFFVAGVSWCGLLVEAILDRAHALTSLTPEGINRHFVGKDEQSLRNDPTKNVAQVGDFVIIDELALGVVEETSTSQYGYESYRVKYIANRPAEGIESDWYSAFELTMFSKRKYLREGLNKWFASVHAEGVPPLNPPPLEDEIDDAFRHSMEEMWTRGIGEYMKQHAIPVWRDRGLQLPEGT